MQSQLLDVVDNLASPIANFPWWGQVLIGLLFAFLAFALLSLAFQRR